jgi:hypothetical protein
MCLPIPPLISGHISLVPLVDLADQEQVAKSGLKEITCMAASDRRVKIDRRREAMQLPAFPAASTP